MSPSGRVMIVTDALRARHHSNAHFADVDAGMLVDGHYTPLPWSENTFTAAWQGAARAAAHGSNR